MSALESLYLHAETQHAGRGLFLLVLQYPEGVDTAGAADAQFVFVFRIEVEQDAAFEHLGIELVRAGHARFLIHRDQDFQGGVFHVVGREDGQCSGYSDTVVGSQGRSFGTYPLAVHYAADAFGIEVELRVGILLVYHVHVSLEDDDGRIFLARGGRFAENDVAHLIDGGIYFVFFSEFLEKFYGFGFLLRAARHGIEVLEIVPYRFGLEGTYVFTHSVLFFGYRFCRFASAKYIVFVRHFLHRRRKNTPAFSRKEF